jgi:hypothetical protein
VNGTGAKKAIMLCENSLYRKRLLPAQKNTANDSLVNPEKIFLPQFHFKLGLMKNYVKAMNRNGESFPYLAQTFPRIRDAEIN